ncbi:hypothetical protein ACIBG8_09730 [Nonomuraea sp. NPDC050556]
MAHVGAALAVIAFCAACGAAACFLHGESVRLGAACGALLGLILVIVVSR